MEKVMTHYRGADMYGLDDFNAFKNENFNDLNNKLFCDLHRPRRFRSPPR